MDRQTGIGIKDRYLMLIFNIILLETSGVETHRRKTNRQIANGQSTKNKYLVSYISNKKNNFEN